MDDPPRKNKSLAGSIDFILGQDHPKRKLILPTRRSEMELAEWMTTAELAAMTRQRESTIRYWRYRGTGPRGVRFGKRVLYRVADVQEWIEALVAAEQRDIPAPRRRA
jgi:predicted DNA-binding transcriptional regulator AlpA